ncbi:hypothetical protein ABEB36_010708 [Hypothenemus hampei]|uniref:DDE Tnp4 domain-containing protein n=1 Tax=Hypothenemus hampei TaxID=57062 RepID=A0ABD1ECT3_HYPHA
MEDFLYLYDSSDSSDEDILTLGDPKIRNENYIADSGYPLQPHLLTPFRDRGQLNERQKYYNVMLAKNRYIIEHCFGILKQKFRQLYHVKLQKMQYIVHLIRAACVLHNSALEDNFDIDDALDNFNIENLFRDANNDIEIVIDVDDVEEEDQNAQRIRDNIVNNLE